MASRCQCLQVLRQTFALYPASRLCNYLGQHYTYDARGNLLERLDNGKKARFTRDLYDRLTRYEDDRLTADFAYDALGRRVAKYSKAHCPPSPGAGPAWTEQQQRTLNAQYDCGQNIYGWDGDTLAYETRYSDNPGERRLIHYFYEPGSFIPVAQTVENRNLSLVREPSHENGYHIDRDPLWQHHPVAKPFNAMAWYQCDHLGTPMELTDQRGEIAWSAMYQAWGLAKEKRTDSAIRENIRNPLRFQGQYFDTETGLHYNRYRYYDPQVGRFISKDPIGFAGGLNVYAYAPNPVGWVDPFGLSSCPCERDCEKILADAGLDVDTHSNLTKRNKGTQYDSHHIYQDNTVASVPGYNRNSAIAITLQGRNADRTTRGSQHYNASQAQNNSSSGGLVGSETVVAFKALRSAGIGSHESKCVVLKARGYLGGLGASAGTTTNLPKNRRGR